MKDSTLNNPYFETLTDVVTDRRDSNGALGHSKRTRPNQTLNSAKLRDPPRLDGWRQGTVADVYAHGLFDSGAYRGWFLERLAWQCLAQDWGVELEAAIDGVARW